MKRRIVNISICMLMITTAFAGIAGVASADDWNMFQHDPENTGHSPVIDLPDSCGIAWQHSFSDAPRGLSIADGKVYVGSDDDYVYCLDADNQGNQLWKFKTNTYADSTPAIVNGKVYVSSSTVYCLDANNNGDLLWYQPISNYGPSSPSVVNGKVYVGSTNDKVYCLDADTGVIVWDYQTGGDVRSSPAVVNGKVYVSPANGKVYCLDDNNNGDLLWDQFITNYGGCSSPSVVNGKVYVGSTNDKVYCLDADTGVIVWDYQTGGKVKSSPAVAYGNVYVGSDDDKVYCLDADTGVIVWDYQTGGDVRSSPAVADNKVYISSSSTLYCLDAEGNPDQTTDLIWSYGQGSNTPPAITDDGVYSVSHSAKKVYCFGLNEPPEIPNQPDGETMVDVGDECTYTTDPVIDPEGSDVFYQFDWDEDMGDWVGTPSDSHVWNTAGEHNVKVRAKDDVGEMSDWSDPLVVQVNINYPPEVPDTPVGPSQGYVDVVYSFSIIGTYTDPEGNDIYFLIDWGDGDETDLIGPYTSGSFVDITRTHQWTTVGNYLVRARSQDDQGAESAFSDPLELHISSLYIGDVVGGFGLSIPIENIGVVSKDVDWTVDIIGGTLSFFQINKQFDGTIRVGGYSTETIVIPAFRIFGRFDMTITIEAPGEPVVTKTVEGFGLFIYIIL